MKQGGPVSILIGTMLQAEEDPAGAIRRLAPLGFESFAVMFWQTLGGVDLPRLADAVRAAAAETGTVVSAVSLYGNPLRGDSMAAETRQGVDELIDCAARFGARVVGCFTGRVKDRPIEESIGPWKLLFSEHLKRAEASGVRLALENCRFGGTWKHGDWNIAINPDAWELLFNEIPSASLGLEWEPCHQLLCLADPVAQLARWTPKIFHIHGKDANVDWEAVHGHGLFGKAKWAEQRTAGFGDSDWTAIIRELLRGGYTGAIDIEGGHDPVYSGERNMEGQVLGMRHLKECRGHAAEPV
jgi:sugar phosphate isomerase/epimerase